MALSYNLNTQKSVSFEHFIENVSNTIEENNIDSLAECATQLQMLSNNRSFFVDYINNQLSEYNKFQKNNNYTAQTLMLYNHPHFYVRANAWPAVTINETTASTDDDLYFFLKSHDHNFSFLTVGYFGAGYMTEIWEYDNKEVIGYKGEDVDLTFLEKTTLPKGKAMLYRASTDIHTQYPPEEFSISINLILNSYSAVFKEQYFFDTRNNQIAGLVPTAGTGRYLLLDLAKRFNNSSTLSILEDLSATHKLPGVRAKAYDSIAYLTDKEYTWKKALLDKDKVVSGYAKLVLEHLE